MSEFDNGEPRKLSFPLSRSVSPIVEGGDLSSPFSITPDWQTTDNDEMVTITLNLTLNEFVALASALDAGRDLAYGDESIEIWKIWTRSVNTLSLCQQIADCINDPNSPTRQALIDALADTENPVLPPSLADNPPMERILGSSVNTASILPSCVNDNVFGLCLQISEMTNSLITQMMDLLELATNTVELAAIAADNVPILSESIDFALWVQNTAAAAYLAAWDDQLKNLIACELFCIATEDCELSLDDIRDYFVGKSTITTPSTVADILSDLELIFSGDILVYGLAALAWSAISQGEKWFGINNSAQVIRIVASFYNDPNSDWTTLCDPCSQPVYAIIQGYSTGGNNGCGVGSNLTNIGASPVNPLWTRYTFKTTANSVAIRGYNFGISLQEIEGRTFIFKRWGFYANAGGGAAGKSCNGGAWVDNNTGFDTNTTQTLTGIQLVTNTTSPTYYIDVEFPT